MTKTTYRIINLNDGSDFIEQYVESMGEAYKVGAAMAKASAEANGCDISEAAKRIVITTVVTEHVSLADAMGL